MSDDDDIIKSARIRLVKDVGTRAYCLRCGKAFTPVKLPVSGRRSRCCAPCALKNIQDFIDSPE